MNRFCLLYSLLDASTFSHIIFRCFRQQPPTISRFSYLIDSSPAAALSFRSPQFGRFDFRILVTVFFFSSFTALISVIVAVSDLVTEQYEYVRVYNKHRIPHTFRVDPFRLCEPPEVCLDSEKSKISSEIRSGGAVLLHCSSYLWSSRAPVYLPNNITYPHSHISRYMPTPVLHSSSPSSSPVRSNHPRPSPLPPVVRTSIPIPFGPPTSALLFYSYYSATTIFI